MKRRLFWKILLGFWLTFIVITQGNWLMFSLLRPLPEESDYTRSIAKMSVSEAASALRAGGDAALKAQLATWPGDQRHQIAVRRVSEPPDSRVSLAQAAVTAPDGVRYTISFHARQPRYRGGIFNIPHEVIMVVTVVGLAFSAILAWYLTRPIESMRAGFGKLAQGDFATRLGPLMGRRRDEIADLARDFDQMAIRLEELVAARDRLLADVSHELRTPLARLNLAIGLARQDPAKLETSLDRIGGEVAKLDEMVGELLTLAKLESGNRGEEYFDFAEVVKGVVQDATFEAAAKGVSVVLALHTDGENAEWLAVGKGKLVSRAVENIIRNAVRYSPNGGNVRVGLSRDSGQFCLLVTDDGPGVPEESLGTLFKPFVQAVSADGSGFGLGLAIAQRAIAVHGGNIVARNRHPKGMHPRGLEMLVTIPAAVLEGT
jgi:two-component system, OmpR family, sensor kinase